VDTDGASSDSSIDAGIPPGEEMVVVCGWWEEVVRVVW
jgi:hypothetical protein